MKNLRDKELLATVTLITLAVVTGFTAYGAKTVLREMPPLTVLFIRILVMLLIFLPFVRKSLPHIFLHLKSLLVLGVLWTGNVAFYILGIKYSTATVSQLLYAMVPIFVLVANYFLVREKVRSSQIIGITLGFVGVGLIISHADGNGSYGTLYGNLLIFIGTICWALYLVFSKHLSVHVSPIGLTVGSITVALFIIGILMMLFEGGSGIYAIPRLSTGGLTSLIYLALVVGALSIIITQWGLKYASAVVVGSTLYVSTFVSALTGVFLLSEKLTLRLITGGIILLAGMYLVSVLPLLRKAKTPAK